MFSPRINNLNIKFFYILYGTLFLYFVYAADDLDLQNMFSCYHRVGPTPCIIPGIEDSKCITLMGGFARGCDNNNRFCISCFLKFFIWLKEHVRDAVLDWCNFKSGALTAFDKNAPI